MFGEWELEGVLARDTFSTWYRAERRGERATVRTLDGSAHDSETVARFMALATLLRRIDDEAVPRVRHTATAAEGEPYHVCEALDGTFLAPKTSPANATWILERVLAGLAACHRAGVLVTALPPERVLLCDDGTVRLLDVGLVELAAEACAELTRVRARWIAPEVALGGREQLDPRADVYAAGALLFALLAGRPPRDGAAAEELLVRAATEAVPSIATVAPSVGGPLAAVVDRALAWDRRERFADPRSMLQALRETRS